MTFISAYSINLKFGPELEPVKETVRYYYLLYILANSAGEINLVHLEDADSTVYTPNILKKRLAKTNKDYYIKLGSSLDYESDDFIEQFDDAISGTINDNMPAEYFTAVAKLDGKYGNNAFALISSSDLEGDLTILAYGIEGHVKEAAELMKKTFHADDFTTHGGQGFSPLKVSNNKVYVTYGFALDFNA